ncbi:MAG: hypothetical protein QOJ43_2255, partial [Gaiellaceae bacterium]|nr:hypothetical protein [Gaiellaceae bacterium]
KFSEPGALSSATPTNFRLPPTAYRSGLDLIASRARCKGESRAWRSEGQGLKNRRERKLRLFLFGAAQLPSTPYAIEKKNPSEASASSSETDPNRSRGSPGAKRPFRGLGAKRIRFRGSACANRSRGSPGAKRPFRGLGAKRDPLSRIPFHECAQKINSASRWRFRPLLRLTFPLARTRPPVEPRPNLAPCSLQGGRYGVEGRPSRARGGGGAQIATFSINNGCFCRS